MTNNQHGQVPEALIDLIDAYAETRHRCGGIYNAKTEAARKAVIEALSGVQALSAAPAVPAGWKAVPVNPTPEMWKAAKTVPDPNPPYPPHYGLVWDAMLAATPTPQAEQQAAPKAAPGDAIDEAMRERDDAEDFIDALLDEVLGHERPDWSNLYGRADALNDVQERMTALHKPAVDKAWGQFQSAKAAPQPAPATQQAGEVVAYLDIGAGGYLDLGSALSDEDLQQLPKGRHALVIAGTYGIDGYVAAPQPSPAAQADSVAAPAIGDELRDTLVAVSAAIAERDDRAAQKMIGEILAASPTPPAEQPDLTKLTERGAKAWAGVDAQALRDGTYQQAAAKAAPADTVVLESALRAIHQSIALIGEPDTERLRTVRRVLRGAVIVAEDAGEAATAPQPAPAPLSDDVVRDAARYRWLRATTNYVTSNGKRIDVRNMPEKWDAAIDAALAAQGGKDAE